MERDAEKCAVITNFVVLHWNFWIFIKSWKTFLTKHVNKEWCSTIGEDGYGPMYENDYKVLMESHGFKVIVAKPYPISYKVTEVTKN